MELLFENDFNLGHSKIFLCDNGLTSYFLAYQNLTLGQNSTTQRKFTILQTVQIKIRLQAAGQDLHIDSVDQD